MPAVSPDSNIVGLADEQDAEVTPTGDVAPLPPEVGGQRAPVLAGKRTAGALFRNSPSQVALGPGVPSSCMGWGVQ